jgi:hypothetical protein
VTDWRYYVTFEGVVSAETEDAAVTAALVDVDNGKIPEVEVEEIGNGD